MQCLYASSQASAWPWEAPTPSEAASTPLPRSLEGSSSGHWIMGAFTSSSLVEQEAAISPTQGLPQGLTVRAQLEVLEPHYDAAVVGTL